MGSNNNSCPILIVDDDEDLCQIMGLVISRQCPVHCEHTLATAKEYLSVADPKIIFLDNNLPDGLGVANISTILSGHPSAKIVMMTADTGDRVRERSLNEGAVRFVEKPFDALSINKIINTLCPELYG